MRVDLDSGARSMARGAVVTIAGSLLGTLLSLVLTFVITHSVSPEKFGLFTVGMTLALLAAVPAILGLDTGVTRFVARGAGLGDERAARGSVQAALLTLVPVSIAAATVLFFEAPFIADRFFHKHKAMYLAEIIALSLPGLAVSRVIISAIQGFGVMGYAAWLNVLRGAVNILVAAPLLALHYGVAGLAWAWVVTAYSNCIFGAWFLARVHPRVFSPVRDQWRFGEILRFSIPQTLTAMLLFAILWTDQVLVARFGTAEQVAIYAIATRVLSPATLVSSSTGQMFGPRIAAGDARGDRQALSKMLKRVTYWNTGISIPFFTMLLLIPGSLLGIFGHRYRDGATALVILAAGEIFNTVTGPIGQMINMSGRPYITLVNNFLVAGMNIVLCIYLIPRYGLTGAAVSTTTSLTVVNVLRLLQVRVIFGFTPFRRDMLRLAVATGVSAVVALPLMLLPHWPQPLLEVVVVTAVIFLVYGGVLWKLGVRDEVRQMLSRPRPPRPALSHQ